MNTSGSAFLFSSRFSESQNLDPLKEKWLELKQKREISRRRENDADREKRNDAEKNRFREKKGRGSSFDFVSSWFEILVLVYKEELCMWLNSIKEKILEGGGVI